MKTTIIKLSIAVIFFTVALPFSSMAQDKVWSFGPEVGINLAKHGRDFDNSKFTPGLLVGGFLTYSVRNTYGFTGKILYSQKGYELNGTKEALSYVEIPVVARLFFNRNGSFRPNLFVGPSFGFLTGAKTKSGDDDYEQVPNYADVYNTFDFGVTGGLGLNYEIAKETRLLLDFRYTHGVTDISKSNADVNNNAIGITAGIAFGI